MSYSNPHVSLKKITAVALFVSLLMLCSFNKKKEANYVFFLHNRFVELFGPDGTHPDYGTVEYRQIIQAFKERGFEVISGLRPANADAKAYAEKTVKQVDSLISMGVSPSHITVVGTSKGGYIAMLASGILKNPQVNFVFIGCCNNEDVSALPELNFCGNILSIYEKSDSLGQSCISIKNHSSNKVSHFKELALNTGLKHGFLYKALAEWMEPAMLWATQQYEAIPSSVGTKINALLAEKSSAPFNGIILLNHNGSTVYERCLGFSDREAKTPLVMNERFVIGSVSKQITAVLVLREFDSGRLKLDAPIRNYLPELKRSWADTVTIHHLLSHTHGITALNEPLLFVPGTQYDYSQLGYELLGRIAERTSGKSFASLSTELFALCNMKNSSHPEISAKHLNAYTQKENGQPETENRSLENYVAAGGFISTAGDLLLWNEHLFGGRLLKESTFKLMMSKQKNAVRDHPVFGKTDYGYGITVSTENDLLMLGQTGFAPGFVSMNFYFPATKTSLIVLENISWHPNDIKKRFYYHTQILGIIKNTLLFKKKEE